MQIRYCLKLISLCVVVWILLSGCAEIATEVANGIAQEMVSGMVMSMIAQDPAKGKVYMENIDNDEFIDSVIEHNAIEGLKREDVLYVSNAIWQTKNSMSSLKYIFVKDGFYRIDSDANTLEEFWEEKSIFGMRVYWSEKYEYLTEDTIVMAEILQNTWFTHPSSGACKHYSVSCEHMRLRVEYREPKRFARRKHDGNIAHRFNDIYKIKEIVDERVAYFLALEQAEQAEKTNNTDSNTTEAPE